VITTCDACLEVERFPFIYRRGCIGCLARHIRNTPACFQSEVIRKCTDPLSREECDQLVGLLYLEEGTP